jgi:hypothetical protein
MGPDERRGVERWFVRRGLPHFIESYDAGTDIWTRSVPVLVFFYFLRGLNALKLRDWSLAQNLAALAGLVAVLVGTWVLANVVRSRPAFSVPRVIGPAELAVFLLGPAIVTASFGGQFADAVESLVEGGLVLVAIYVVTSYGLVATAWWAVGRIRDQLFALGQLLGRALPLLTLTVTFLFLTTESWQVAASLYGPSYWVFLAMFAVIGITFVVTRIPRDVRDLASFESWADVAPLLTGTPADGLGVPADGIPSVRSLRKRQWVNVGLVSLISQGVQVLLVMAVVFTFIVAFGVLAVGADLTESWAGSAPHVLAHAHLGDRPLVLTEELLRVAGFLTAFTGLNFTVYLVTDQTYREEFRGDVVAEVRQAFAVRAAYLEALAAPV